MHVESATVVQLPPPSVRMSIATFPSVITPILAQGAERSTRQASMSRRRVGQLPIEYDRFRGIVSMTDAGALQPARTAAARSGGNIIPLRSAVEAACLREKYAYHACAGFSEMDS
jgi:hypothetical protein